MCVLFFVCDLGQFSHLIVLDNDESVRLILVTDGKIQVYSNLRTVYMIDQTIVAHSAHKRNTVPLANHTVAYVICGPVAHTIEIISLIAHAVPNRQFHYPSAYYQASQF